MITMVCKDDILENQVVTDKDFLINYDLRQWQLDKMKEFGLKKGFFTFKSYDFLLYKDNKKVEAFKGTDIIKLPNVKKNGRKVHFLFTDIMEEENIPPSNTYITYMTIYDESKPIDTYILFIDKQMENYHTIAFDVEMVPVEKMEQEFEVTKLE